jgi:uncharacterized protein (TIGR02246 family)
MKGTKWVAAFLIVAGCAQTVDTPVHDQAADLAAIDSVRAAYVAAFNVGDATALAANYASDGQSMDHGQTTASGSAGVDANMKAAFEQMSGTIEISPSKTEVSGDLAYDLGAYKTTMAPKAGGAPAIEVGRYLVVLKRQTDGSWKIAAHMGNLPAPAAPPAK